MNNQPNLQQQQQKYEIEKSEAEKLKHLQEASQPLWLTKQFVDRPCISMMVGLFVFLVSFLVASSSQLISFSEQEDRDWYVWDHAKVIHRDMYEQAEEIFKQKTSQSTVQNRSQKVNKWSTVVLLECDTDYTNVLNPEGFEILLKLENGIKALKGYKNFCLSESQDTNHCAKEGHKSISKTLTEQQITKQKLSQQEINNTLNYILQESVFPNYSYMLSKQFTKSNLKSPVMYFVLEFGAPIEQEDRNYKNRYDDFDDQEKEFRDFSQDIMDYIEEINENDNHGIHVIATSSEIAQLEMNKVVGTDLMLSLVSIIFVMIYMTIHLKSFFLSSFSILGILVSFPVTLIIFKGILRVEYFSFLHILVIFIVLGIAADDIFVYYDAWNQTKDYEFMRNDYHKRMAVTFRRASKKTKLHKLRCCLCCGPKQQSIKWKSSQQQQNQQYQQNQQQQQQQLQQQQQQIPNQIQLQPLNQINLNNIPQNQQHPQQQPYQQQQQHQIQVPLYQQVEMQPLPHQQPIPQQQQQQQQQKQQEQKQEESRIGKFLGQQLNNFVYKLRYIIIILTVIWMIVAVILHFHQFFWN